MITIKGSRGQRTDEKAQRALDRATVPMGGSNVVPTARGKSMAEIETGFSETAGARRAVEEDRKRVKKYLLRRYMEVWTSQKCVDVPTMQAIANEVAEGKHAGEPLE